MYVNHPKESLKGILLQSKGTVLIKTTQIRWFSEQSGGRLGLERGGQRLSKLS
jgi:hypothetical protein